MPDAIQKHDPQKSLADLRDHLARHDKPIAFLFGAGTSCAVRIPEGGDGKTKALIPAVVELTELCKKASADEDVKFSEAWAKIEEYCKASGHDIYIESVLSRLRMMINAAGADDKLAGLTRDEVIALEKSVRKTIASLVTPGEELIPDELPHQKLARWLSRTSRQRPVEIFTLNYDVLIEHSLETERVPFYDGFTGSFFPFFHAESLRRSDSAPGSNWTRLWKMHGSVTWQRRDYSGNVRIVRGAPNGDGEMILPSFEKYDESRQQPYSAMSERLSRFLEQDDALLIVAGYNFGDAHINNIIFGALESRPRTHVYALQFEEPGDTHEVVKRAMQRPNLVMIAPKSGIFGGVKAKWRSISVPNFLKAHIEVIEAPEDEGKEDQIIVHVGDFSKFCDLLVSMVGE